MRKHPKAYDIKTKHYSKMVKLQDGANVSVGATATAGDSTCGKHGIAQKRRGAKKFVNSRFRFHVNMEARELQKFEAVNPNDAELRS